MCKNPHRVGQKRFLLGLYWNAPGVTGKAWTPVGLKMRPIPDLDGEGVQPIVQHRLGAIVGPLQRQDDCAVAPRPGRHTGSLLEASSAAAGPSCVC
jgi:hypothetical protein